MLNLHFESKDADFATNTLILFTHILMKFRQSDFPLKSLGSKRLEVYGTQSDLAIADFDQNRMILSPLTHDKKVLETFPTFSADGSWIYYVPLRKPLCRTASINYITPFAA